VRVRLWVIGAALILGGFASHVIFDARAADVAGRIEMGQFAYLEAVLFAAGFGLIFISLMNSSPGRNVTSTRLGWLLWVTAALIASGAVLRRLPP
jgi:heme/copper-type cytochrome/quinol oxidase subunit 3